MPDSGNGGCGGCCCKLIFTLGLTSLFMWLSLRTSNPKCSIEKFYLPSLNQTLNTPNDTTLNLTVKLSNPNKDKGIKYDPVNVTVFDSSNRSHVVGNVLVPAFYQGHKKNAKKDGTGTANTTVALRTVSGNGTGVFRVDLSTSVKFKIIFWYTKRKKISVGADVMVNAGSAKVGKKGIKLKSMAPRMGSFCAVMGGLVNLSVFILLNFCRNVANVVKFLVSISERAYCHGTNSWGRGIGTNIEQRGCTRRDGLAKTVKLSLALGEC